MKQSKFVIPPFALIIVAACAISAYESKCHGPLNRIGLTPNAELEAK